MPIDARDLRAEMVRRVNDGWDVVGELTPNEMRMVHAVPPPAWRILLELLNPLT